MNFSIKKNSTLPILKYPLSQHIREKYDIADNMFENIAVTFSMVDAETGRYVIANTAGNLNINENTNVNIGDDKYELTFKFKESHTSKSGRYYAEFVIDFLSPEAGCGKLKLPIDGAINVMINDSNTKTTVI